MEKEDVGYVEHVHKGKKRKMNEDNELEMMVKIIAVFIAITWVFAAIGIAALLIRFVG